jgi:hypothetical protein
MTFFCSEARAIARTARLLAGFSALHERTSRVKMASSRALAHLFTVPNRYN